MVGLAAWAAVSPIKLAYSLGVFDAIDTRPWVGAQLSGNPWQYAVLRILEGIGAKVMALGVRDQARFNVATALLSFILGLAGQYAVGSRHFAGGLTELCIFVRWRRNSRRYPTFERTGPPLSSFRRGR